MPVISIPPDEVAHRLRTPQGAPISFSPLMGSASSPSSPPGLPVLSLMPEPHKELSKRQAGDFLHRTISGCSTEVPDEDHSPGDRHDDFHEDVAGGQPLLHSELARWAQAAVETSEERRARELVEGHSFAGRHEYLVDNSNLRADTLGLAFRKSKNPWDRDHTIHGPTWGSFVSGYDDGDGWIRVGHHYLPKDLLGAQVLVRKDDAMTDGPALTQDGRVLDLDGGAAMHFFHDKGAELRRWLKEEHRMNRAAMFAHRACEAEARIEACEVCALDAAGVVHGALPAPVQLGRSPNVPKRAHRRLQQRRRRAAARAEESGYISRLTMGNRDEGGEPARLCMGEDGKVFIFLELSGCDRAERARARIGRRLRAVSVPEDEGPAYIADMAGVVHF